MDDYPNSDEEFELMYGDELDLLRELEGNNLGPIVKPTIPNKKARKSLDFTSPEELHSGKPLELPGTVRTSQSKPHDDSDILFSQEFENSSVASQSASYNTNDTSLSQVFEKSQKTCPIKDNIFNKQTSNEDGHPSNLKKRSIQELFGEIDDILSEEIVEGRVKKRKSNNKEQDSQFALIEHIVQLRKLAKERQNPFVMSNKDATINNCSRDNISYQVPKYSFVVITKHNGERIYVRCHSEQYEQEEIERTVKKSTFAGIMGEQFKEIWKKAEEYINSNLNKENVQHKEAQNNSDAVPILGEVPETNTQLWVDLYKPQRYLELLSDESTNRTLLRWIKLWDKIVFNRRPKQKIKSEPQTQFNTFKKELDMNLDEHGRPQYKVVLLCGPPGLGKTTLAHMVATHAGYNVVEVNASDDRSTEEFKTVLENSTQMRSVLDKEKRPNCIVFDEIDGAPSASIEYLVKFINGTNTIKKKKGVKQASQILKRPIICICNDVFVPALRPLRQIAFVVNFPPTVGARLAERLNEIARHQKIKTDFGALNALCEKCGNDIRACLSVLHFFKALSKPITLSEVYKSNVGQKDMQKGLFAVWKDIFQFQQSKHNTNKTEDTRHNTSSLKNRMEKVLQVVNAFGDHERLAQGVFENYPSMNIRDTSLMSTCESLEWFCFTDVLNKQIYSLHDYSLFSYLSYAFVVWHFAFATSAWVKLTYPSAGYEAKNRLTKNAALVTEIMKGMQPSVRAFTCSSALKQDVLPILSQIIVPPFRPVNLHLFTDREKEALQNVVSIMIDYNLTYVQERMPEGNYIYIIDPNIEEVTLFPGTKPIRLLSYFNKQLIAREIEVMKMRRTEIHKLGEPVDKNKKSANKENQTANVPNHLQKLKAKEVPRPRINTVAKDFFGRVITTSAKGTSGIELNNDVWYQYKEGYNNAVRKNVKISSLK